MNRHWIIGNVRAIEDEPGRPELTTAFCRGTKAAIDGLLTFNRVLGLDVDLNNALKDWQDRHGNIDPYMFEPPIIAGLMSSPGNHFYADLAYIYVSEQIPAIVPKPEPEILTELKEVEGVVDAFQGSKPEDHGYKIRLNQAGMAILTGEWKPMSTTVFRDE